VQVRSSHLDPPILSFVGGRQWRLEADFWFPDAGRVITVPKGFLFDLSSVPRALWWLIAPFDLSVVAPLIHDFLYRYGGKPPAGSIPRGYQPFHYGPGDAEAARAGRELTNPLPDVEAVRARGAVAFARWCSPCHGAEGLGDGLVARKFPRPPSLVAEHARGLPDGRIFHIVTYGQGVMPAYGQQVGASDRWKIVRHLRQLGVAAVPAAPTGGSR